MPIFTRICFSRLTLTASAFNDDPRAVNRPALPKKTVGAVVAGTSKAAAALAGEIASRLKAAPGKNVVVGFDGYATADWTRMVNLLSQQLLGKGIGVDVAAFTEVLKSEREIADMINPNLEWDTSKDPSLLFGRLIERGYEDLLCSMDCEVHRMD